MTQTQLFYNIDYIRRCFQWLSMPNYWDYDYDYYWDVIIRLERIILSVVMYRMDLKRISLVSKAPNYIFMLRMLLFYRIWYCYMCKVLFSNYGSHRNLQICNTVLPFAVKKNLIETLHAYKNFGIFLTFFKFYHYSSEFTLLISFRTFLKEWTLHIWKMMYLDLENLSVSMVVAGPLFHSRFQKMSRTHTRLSSCRRRASVLNAVAANPMWTTWHAALIMWKAFGTGLSQFQSVDC